MTVGSEAESGSGAEVDSATEETTRFRLDISYDGTAFSGWSRQPGLRTVQGVLEDALATVFARHPPVASLVVAGRTDAGVHALGQVAHLDLTPAQLKSLERPHRGPAKGKRLPAAATLAKRLNGIAGLDSDVHVARAIVAPHGFDARFSATWRRYEYRISDGAGPRNPLQRAYTLWYPSPLDVGPMQIAARSLLGLHDWTSYCKPRDIGTSIRTLQRFDWTTGADGVLLATVTADAFCHSMVRALVGATVAVGEGKLAPDELVDIRDELARTNRFKIVPAKGLTLLEVGYPPDHDLAARAVQTRAIRPALLRADEQETDAEGAVAADGAASTHEPGSTRSAGLTHGTDVD